MARELILLAGGKSSRMGEPKGLRWFRGMRWIQWQLQRARQAADVEVVVVLGHHVLEYSAVLADERVVVNLEPEKGPFSSLLCGLQAVSSTKPVFLLPIDVPAPSSKVWQTLEIEIENRDACIPTYEGKGGHPVLLSSDFKERLLKEKATSRLDWKLREARTRRVAVDERVTLNLNTPELFESYSSSFSAPMKL